MAIRNGDILDLFFASYIMVLFSVISNQWYETAIVGLLQFCRAARVLVASVSNHLRAFSFLWKTAITVVLGAYEPFYKKRPQRISFKAPTLETEHGPESSSSFECIQINYVYSNLEEAFKISSWILRAPIFYNDPHWIFMEFYFELFIYEISKSDES